jgi:N-acetylmuramoyl-L-alanine amidase
MTLRNLPTTVLALFLALLASGANGDAQPAKAVLSQIRYASTESRTRVTLELSSEVRFETHTLKDDPSKGLPSRIYIDLIGSRLGADAKQPISIQEGLLRRVRTAQFSADVVRVVLDMTSLGDYRTSFLSDPYRLVVDIEARDSGEKTSLPEKKKEPVAQAKAPKPPVTGLRKIVIDPGHGGKDPGAIGVVGVAEKDVVLSVARKLALKLK